MASAIIHICVAKKINEKLQVEEKPFLLGSIAPDISKQIGEAREKSHFLTSLKSDVPDIRAFLDKYQNSLNNPFLLGYFVHLYTDKIWFDEFMRERLLHHSIHLLDGTTVNLPPDEIREIIYNDYTNINVDLIDEYDLDLSLFYEDFPLPNVEMDEIPVSKLPILIDKMSIIIENSKKTKGYVFDMPIIIEFIEYATTKILHKIEEYQIEYH